MKKIVILIVYLMPLVSYAYKNGGPCVRFTQTICNWIDCPAGIPIESCCTETEFESEGCHSTAATARTAGPVLAVKDPSTLIGYAKVTESDPKSGNFVRRVKQRHPQSTEIYLNGNPSGLGKKVK